MPTRIEYSQERELDDALAAVLNDTGVLAKVTDHCKVAACFCMRQNDQEQEVAGKGEPISLKKVSPVWQVFMKPRADFVVVVDYYFWKNATPKEKRGMMIRTLTRIGIENTNNGTKLSIRSWDIQDNIASVRESGVYNDQTSRAAEAYERVRPQHEAAQELVNNMEKAAGKLEVKPEAELKPKVKAKAKAKAVEDDEPPMRPARKPPIDQTEADPEPE